MKYAIGTVGLIILTLLLYSWLGPAVSAQDSNFPGADQEESTQEEPQIPEIITHQDQSMEDILRASDIENLSNRQEPKEHDPLTRTEKITWAFRLARTNTFL